MHIETRTRPSETPVHADYIVHHPIYQLAASQSYNLLDHASAKRSFTSLLRLSLENTSHRCLQPLVRDSQLRSLCVLYIANEEWIRPLHLALIFSTRAVVDNFATTLGGLFLEEAVDRVELKEQ